ncbi:MAG TPA: glutathione S-transferase family protein [Xanthobacteraceae bacterium]|nr:glutathione S-transferase family protein [Xanthobacteraceae bacterium]
MPRLTLVSHDLCPYVQRAAIALAEKGVAYERIYIDLANKPDWFKAISPLGKVPLLRVGDDIIFESAVILEYLDETLPNPLLPRDTLMRAKHRAMVEFGSAILADIWGIETAPTRVVLDAKVATLRDKFVRLEAMLGQGPWFGGDAFGVVDAAFGPVFRYFDLFDAVFDHGAMTGLPKVARWRAALAARSSVQNAVLPDYRDRLQDFVRAQNGALAELIIGHANQAPAA